MSYTILTGFGPTTDDLQLFRVAVGSDGMYGDWQSDPLDSIQQIAGTNQYDVHDMGEGPATLTLSLEFDTRADFAAFHALRKTEGVLQLINGFTHHDATVFHRDGRDYARYTDTTLHRVTGISHKVGGTVECTATFMREEPTL